MTCYPFHIDAYMKAAYHLTWDEDIAYRRLLDLYYTTGKPLRLDRRDLYRRVRATTRKQKAAVDRVLEEFFVQTPDGWRQPRCDRELEAARLRRERAEQAAKARWSQNKETDALRPEGKPTPAEPAPGAKVAAKKPRKPETPVPPDFWPDETGCEIAAKHGVDLARESARFISYHQSKDSRMRDWQAAWRGWCMRAQAFSYPARAAQRGTSRHSGFDALDYRAGINTDGTFA
ncbi:DUF1376 domain-containing protein [Haematospirillum sp. H1815]|uniref:DUF1376 domain-containing protein n=1 Tax=Haematospirillum sp. H1815 TaxID=2723108 RepID=UPI00143B93EA|nr:DUF1376 domain-containing protein [Haematospirillum sp. H1815]NKD76585.1 DUF1376 domain-containing protein [Haematospirillum sp. H1815]